MHPWKKTFYAAWIGQVCSITGFFFIWPLMPLYLKELSQKTGGMDDGDIALWSGIAASVTALTMAVFQPIWGALADRYGRKPMVLRSMVSGTVILLLMAHARNVTDFVLLRMMQGALTGTVTASVALVSSTTPRSHSDRALGLMSAATFCGMAIGPLAGGVLAEYIGFYETFWVAAGVLVAGALIVARFADEQFVAPPKDGSDRPASFRQVLAVAGFATALVALFQVRFANSVFRPVFALFVEDLHGQAKGARLLTGVITCSASIAAAVSAGVLFGRAVDRWGHKRLLVMSTLVAGLLTIPIALAGSVWQLLLFRVLFGFAVAVTTPTANVIIRRIIHQKHLGKAYGITASVTCLGWGIGPLIGGWVGREVGIRAPFVVAAALLIVSAPVIHRCLTVPAEPAPEQ